MSPTQVHNLNDSSAETIVTKVPKMLACYHYDLFEATPITLPLNGLSPTEFFKQKILEIKACFAHIPANLVYKIIKDKGLVSHLFLLLSEKQLKLKDFNTIKTSGVQVYPAAPGLYELQLENQLLTDWGNQDTPTESSLRPYLGDQLKLLDDTQIYAIIQKSNYLDTSLPTDYRKNLEKLFVAIGGGLERFKEIIESRNAIATTGNK